MRDLVENRKRVSFWHKLKVAAIAIRENGPLWCSLFLTYYVASTVAHGAFTAMDRLRRRRALPGLNSAALNKEIWNAWEWSAQGDEWTHSAQWKDSLIRCVLQQQIAAETQILEIGPGAGRWTGPLLERARSYVGIDISAACVDYCRKRFGTDPRARFEVGSGRDLAAVADASIDAVWSFDVFVHINCAEIEGYADEFARVLRPGAVAVIHHGGVGGAQGGWRSNLTASALQEIMERHGLRIERSFDRWKDGDAVHGLIYGDLISVISKRPSAVVLGS
jgi:ubiquinone/menaquinone biosynthesis C-methylase UbiE